MDRDNACGISSLFVFEENFNTDNYANVLEETVKEIR